MAACFGRRSYEKGRVKFGDGVHWVYPEDSCDNMAIPGEKLCQLCKDRNKKTGKLQSQPGYPHGIIGEEIPANSQIYGGPWYEAGVIKWGVPVIDDLKSLEEAKERVMKKYFAVGEKTVSPPVKKVTAPAPSPVETVKSQKVGGIIVAMELDEDPIIPEEVVEVVLKISTIKSVSYYVDESGGMYLKEMNGSVGRAIDLKG